MKDYKGITFEGATFPDSPYKIIKVVPNNTIVNEYLPVLNEHITASKGTKLLITAMAIQEGFKQGTRSHKTNNPGNIGNVDSGANKGFATLADGIQAQADFIIAVAEGKKKAYPIGQLVFLKPTFSPEIAKNQATYGLGNGNVPGYKFTFTGQLDQFIKIYATAPRLSNNYLNTIISYFSQNEITITPTTTLQEIIAMN